MCGCILYPYESHEIHPKGEKLYHSQGSLDLAANFLSGSLFQATYTLLCMGRGFFMGAIRPVGAAFAAVLGSSFDVCW